MIETLVLSILAATLHHELGASVFVSQLELMGTVSTFLILTLTLRAYSQLPHSFIVLSGITGLFISLQTVGVSPDDGALDALTTFLFQTGRSIGFGLLWSCAMLLFIALVELAMRALLSIHAEGTTLAEQIPFAVLRFWLVLAALSLTTPYLISI